ncbi:MAG TPA: hypothetical protein VGA92_02535 [Candidatus Nitrosotenuis sp.]|jgi:hypothetical protein
MSYYELWTILSNWRDEFTSEDFARTFASPNPRKVLHDMTGKGLLEHRGYGRYRVRPVDEYVRSKNDVSSGYELLKKSDLPYALTDVDGVFVWTKGGYNAGRFFGSYPIHMKVLKSDVARWKRFLTEKGRKVTLGGKTPRETLFGVYYILYPEVKVKSETEGGLKVEPLKDTVEFCKKNIYTFEPALEMLDEEYNLGLKVRYSR